MISILILLPGVIIFIAGIFVINFETLDLLTGWRFKLRWGPIIARCDVAHPISPHIAIGAIAKDKDVLLKRIDSCHIFFRPRITFSRNITYMGELNLAADGAHATARTSLGSILAVSGFVLIGLELLVLSVRDDFDISKALLILPMISLPIIFGWISIRLGSRQFRDDLPKVVRLLERRENSI